MPRKTPTSVESEIARLSAAIATLRAQKKQAKELLASLSKPDNRTLSEKRSHAAKIRWEKARMEQSGYKTSMWKIHQLARDSQGKPRPHASHEGENSLFDQIENLSEE